MRKLLGILVGVILLTLVPTQAHAADGCVLNLAGVKVCGTLLGQPLPEVVRVTQTLPPITVPGPTRTVTVRPPQVPERTRTLLVPGPTKTVYSSRPEATQRPVPSKTPEAVPTTTVTETITATPRQKPGTDGKVAPSNKNELFRLPPVSVSTPEAVGIGLVGLLALVGLILLAMYGGYILGYKDRERKDTDFMRALLDSVKSRGKHS